MLYCEKCAIAYSLPWDLEVMKEIGLYGLCGICGLVTTCIRVDPKDIFIKNVKESKPSGDKKDTRYEDPIYELPNGEHIDLGKLICVDKTRCNITWLQVCFDYNLKGLKNSHTQSRCMRDDEIIKVPKKNGPEDIFVKLIKGGHILKDSPEVSPASSNNVVAYHNMEEERQKLIIAWRRYKRFVFNNSNNSGEKI
jgi:hypothetical protein